MSTLHKFLCREQPGRRGRVLGPGLNQRRNTALRRLLLVQFQDHAGRQGGPAGLVAGAHARPCVSVEILMEGNVVAPVRVELELFIVAEYRPASADIALEGA